jgi:hypothetical protein
MKPLSLPWTTTMDDQPSATSAPAARQTDRPGNGEGQIPANQKEPYHNAHDDGHTLGKLLTQLTKKQIKAVEKTFPPPLRRLLDG